MKNIVVISTSLRAGSNSEMLAKEFARGAEDAGNRVDFISLKGKKINYCIGCFKCFEDGECAIKDDVQDIEEKVLNADVVVWASPIYYFEMAGQMKTLIDRLNPMYKKAHKFRDVYVLSVAADEGDDVSVYAEQGVQGWCRCFEGAEIAATLFCGGLTDANAIKGSPKLAEAYELGRNA